MVDKKELITILKDCLNSEEASVPIYNKHINSALFFSGFKPEIQDRIKEILSLLAKGSEAHKFFYNNLLKEIRDSKRDVY